MHFLLKNHLIQFIILAAFCMFTSHVAYAKKHLSNDQILSFLKQNKQAQQVLDGEGEVDIDSDSFDEHSKPTVLIDEPQKIKNSVLIQEADSQNGFPNHLTADPDQSTVLIPESTNPFTVLVSAGEDIKSTILYQEPIAERPAVLFVEKEQEFSEEIAEYKRKFYQTHLLHEDENYYDIEAQDSNDEDSDETILCRDPESPEEAPKPIVKPAKPKLPLPKPHSHRKKRKKKKRH